MHHEPSILCLSPGNLLNVQNTFLLMPLMSAMRCSCARIMDCMNRKASMHVLCSMPKLLQTQSACSEKQMSSQHNQVHAGPHA